jgi:translation initiation factor IF-2
VLQGAITRASTGVRVIRDGVVVYQGKLGSLRRFKDDVREVQTGYECGIGVENFNDVKVGDVIEAFSMEKIAAKL